MLAFVIVLGLTSNNFLWATESCQEWLSRHKVKKGPDCYTDCLLIKEDFAYSHCPLMCDSLCEVGVTERFLFSLSDLYPGLTLEERSLAAKHPKKMLQAYKLSWEAEALCAQVYRSSQTNDASDACRHFVWAGLLTKALGIEFGTRVLNAHEQDEKQPEAEKAMDLANNRLGQMTAKKLIEKGKFDGTAAIKSFKDNLKKGRVIILRKPKEVSNE